MKNMALAAAAACVLVACGGSTGTSEVPEPDRVVEAVEDADQAVLDELQYQRDTFGWCWTNCVSFYSPEQWVEAAGGMPVDAGWTLIEFWAALSVLEQMRDSGSNALETTCAQVWDETYGPTYVVSWSDYTGYHPGAWAAALYTVCDS